ncbi:hypothetical protein IGI04_030903, partial [Brassica rapa subsp. trilocularis]
MRSLCTTSRSDSSRATAQGRSRFHVWRHTFTPRSDLPERRAEVAPEAQSDHTRATGRSRSRFHHPETRERARSDLSQRHSEEDPLAVNEVEGLEGQEELCFINNNGSWYKKEPNFQYNNYQQKSYPNNQQSGYPPRNNQQGSYQPQQNPSSGSSAPQESSTDTLLKQILESQTRSEKHVGYELKNLHTKIDGSYNELNNKFSHLASTLRATGRSRSRFHHPETRERARSDLSQRHSEVAPETWSDLSERRAEVAPCFVSARTCDFSRASWSFHYAPTRRQIIFVLRKTTKNLWRGISLNELIN